MKNPTVVIVGSDQQSRNELAEFIKVHLQAAGLEAAIDELKSAGGISGYEGRVVRIKTAPKVYFPGTKTSTDEIIV